MRKFSTEEALAILARDNYCLWVGAGVSTHLGMASGKLIPSWATLVERLEHDAGLVPPPGVAYPERLSICSDFMGQIKFQRALRKHLVHELANALIQAKTDLGAEVPAQVRQIAQLGCMANPCINFNIEVFTSMSLLDSWGPWKLLAFTPPVPGASPRSFGSIGSLKAGVARRLIYHPHGALDISGVCVMTGREYNALRGTLALQLAVHAAFGQDLAIVGMSLDDEYLREQLSSFRDQINQVWWFQDRELPPDLARWAYENQIHVCCSEWPAFWTAVERVMSCPDRKNLAGAWRTTLIQADFCLHGPASLDANSFLRHWPDDLELQVKLLQRALMAGEDIYVDPQSPRWPTDFAMAIMAEAAREALDGSDD